MLKNIAPIKEKLETAAQKNNWEAYLKNQKILFRFSGWPQQERAEMAKRDQVPIFLVGAWQHHINCFFKKSNYEAIQAFCNRPNTCWPEEPCNKEMMEETLKKGFLALTEEEQKNFIKNTKGLKKFIKKRHTALYEL